MHAEALVLQPEIVADAVRDRHGVRLPVEQQGRADRRDDEPEPHERPEPSATRRFRLEPAQGHGEPGRPDDQREAEEQVDARGVQQAASPGLERQPDDALGALLHGEEQRDGGQHVRGPAVAAAKRDGAYKGQDRRDSEATSGGETHDALVRVGTCGGVEMAGSGARPGRLRFHREYTTNPTLLGQAGCDLTEAPLLPWDFRPSRASQVCRCFHCLAYRICVDPLIFHGRTGCCALEL